MYCSTVWLVVCSGKTLNMFLSEENHSLLRTSTQILMVTGLLDDILLQQYRRMPTHKRAWWSESGRVSDNDCSCLHVGAWELARFLRVHMKFEDLWDWERANRWRVHTSELSSFCLSVLAAQLLNRKLIPDPRQQPKFYWNLIFQPSIWQGATTTWDVHLLCYAHRCSIPVSKFFVYPFMCDGLYSQ